MLQSLIYLNLYKDSKNFNVTISLLSVPQQEIKDLLFVNYRYKTGQFKKEQWGEDYKYIFNRVIIVFIEVYSISRTVLLSLVSIWFDLKC